MKKSTSIETNSIKNIKTTDVCPSYFGVIENIDGEDTVVTVIKKNTPRPCSVTKSYFTVYDNQQSINFKLTSSNSLETDPSFVTIVWDGGLPLPPGRPAGQEVKVTFSFDDNGVMQASILNVESGKKTDTFIGGIDPNSPTYSESVEIDQFTVDDDMQEVGSKYGGKFIGIDLGTTYSAISYIDDNGRPKIIANSEGQNITPSCIQFEGDTVTVGEEARKSLGFSKNVLARFKRDMGTLVKYTVDGKDYTPTDCSALVLKKLIQNAKREIGEIGETVVTVPANFGNEARVATLTAAKLAGLNVENIVEEPTAAALYYTFEGGLKLNGNYAIYDLGGSTFDVSIIKAEGIRINMVASEGVQKLGGDDFDVILKKIAKKKLKDEHDEIIYDKDYTKTDAEEDKKSLSKREAINVRVNRKNVKITRIEFEEKISSLVIQTEMLCESILNDNNLTAEEIQEVFLVGGSTRVPLVQQAVEKVFKKKPIQSVNVDKAVVLGASLYAALKGVQSKPLVQQKSVNKILDQSQDDDSSEIDKWLLD